MSETNGSSKLKVMLWVVVLFSAFEHFLSDPFLKLLFSAFISKHLSNAQASLNCQDGKFRKYKKEKCTSWFSFFFFF